MPPSRYFMLLLLISIAWVLCVAGLLARAITQYWHYEIIGPAPLRENAAASVTVIVPARNEARNIERCVVALLEQEPAGQDLRVIVMDDHSEDQTAAIVRGLAQRDERVVPRQAAALPAGWLGKPHACWQAAREAPGDWLCFIDADTTARPPLIRTALRAARRRGADLLSLQPFQELISPWERLLLPCGFFLIAFTQDLRTTGDPASPEAAVNGQFLLVRRSAYDAAGGHAQVRNQAAEDSALARNVKAAGFRVAVLGTQGLLHTRMYADARSLWQGAARQASTLLPGAGMIVAAVAALLLAGLTVALPAWAIAAVCADPGAQAITALVLAGIGSLALFGTHIGAARYFRIPFWYGLLFPAGYVLGAAVLLYGQSQRMRGRVAWKGRIYAGSQPSGGPVGQTSEVPSPTELGPPPQPAQSSPGAGQ